MDDPIKTLDRALVAAAKRQARTLGASRTQRRRKTALAGVAATLIVAAPAAGFSTGLIDLGSGDTPDGSAYKVTEATADSAGVSGRCATTEFTGPEGKKTTTVTSCGPQSVVQPHPHLAVDATVAPGGTQLITGGVSSNVARVAVSGSNEPRLVSVPGTSIRRFSVVLKGSQRVHVEALDSSGAVIQELDAPILRP